MENESANVMAYVQPEVKQQAERILEQLGIPVSVLIDALYRQVIVTGGVPYSLTVPKLPTKDGMTDDQFYAIMEKGYQQAVKGQTVALDDAFAKIYKSI